LYFAGARLGDLRLKGAYAWRSLLDAGATICAGSDAPVEKGDPLIEFYAAVYRHSQEGFAGPSWGLDQVVTRAEALRMLTWAPAYACGREQELGSLELGKRADLSVFSKDLMTVAPAEILQAKAVMTVVDGEVVFGG
jgi:predicted amidohydrolase YtcJ